MKFLLAIFFIIVTKTTVSQIPNSGTYTYNYCDKEYNKCLVKCKIKIKGNKIWVYAPDNLSGIKEGELFYSGILYKPVSGKWRIIHSEKEKSSTIIDSEGPPWIDFKIKSFWTY